MVGASLRRHSAKISVLRVFVSVEDPERIHHPALPDFSDMADGHLLLAVIFALLAGHRGRTVPYTKRELDAGQALIEGAKTERLLQ
ncbi:MAG: hypothetical protein ACTH8J_16885, partial [Specibacter sp.]